MIRNSRTVTWVCLLIATAPALAAEPPRAGDLALEAHTLRTFDGQEHPAELGRLWVLENRGGGSDRLIQIAFLRLKSTAAEPGPPIVFLMGGAGRGIVMGQIPPFFQLFDRLRAVGDVILLDQRGIGESIPNLECAADHSPAPDVLESAEKMLAEQLKSTLACAEKFRTQGVDLASYNVNARADDLDELRRALGAEKLNLLAWSAGTETALAALRRHPGRLHRVVLSGVVGPDQILSLPTTADLQLKKISLLVAQSPAYQDVSSDLATVVGELLRRVGKQPITLTVQDRRTKQPVTITVGEYALRQLIQGDLSDGRALPRLPALLYALSSDDTELFVRKAEGMYNGSAGSSLTGLLLGCTSGWSPERLARVEREAKDALLGTGAFPLPELCARLGTFALGPEARSRVWSTVPTLFLTGTLDAATPPFQAEEVRWGFPNGAHLVIDNATHDLFPISEVQSVVVDFLRGQDVRDRHLSFPAPQFISIGQAKPR